MAENLSSKIKADLLQGLSLGLVDCHSVAKPHWELKTVGCDTTRPPLDLETNARYFYYGRSFADNLDVNNASGNTTNNSSIPVDEAVIKVYVSYEKYEGPDL